MKNRAFLASFEATLSLLVLVAIMLAAERPQEPPLDDLFLLQKEHDLLILWAKNGIPSESEMKKDFALAFPSKSGEIWVNEKKISIGKTAFGEAIAAEMVFFSPKMEKTRIRLLVFK